MPDIHTKLIGTWKLVTCDMEYKDSGAREPYFGAAPPCGYLILTREGRMIVLLVSGEREPGQTDEQQAALFRTMMAYTGCYRFESDRFITNVDVSWNEEWTGTEQVRFYTLDGERLDILTAWVPHPTHPERRMIRGILSWERAQ
jgi:uncharacterized protein YifE (UPF0438 family)